MKLGFGRVAMLALLAASVGCSGTAFDIPDDARPIAELPGRERAAPELGPGDVLRVTFFGRNELSGEFLIDQQGTIQYPLAGRVQVAGLSGDEAADTLREALRDHFNNPELSVTPLIRVNVLGAVVQPGLYPLDPTFSVFDAIGSAGGPSREANFERVLLVRRGEYFVIDTRKALRSERSLAQIGVESGDVILVPQRARTAEQIARFSSVFTAVAAVLNTILILVTR